MPTRGSRLPNPTPSLSVPKGVATAAVGEGRVELLSAVARGVTGRRDLSDVLAVTLTELRRLVRFTRGSIQLLDDDGWIRLAAAEPTASLDLYDVRVPLDASLAGRIVLTERPVYLPDVTAGGPGASSPQANLWSDGTRSYFGVPLLADGHAIGVLQIDSSEPSAWDGDERMLVTCIAPVVAAAIQNARSQARINAAELAIRRVRQRGHEVRTLLEHDVEAAVAALVALSVREPDIRGDVERLVTAIARARVVASLEDSDAPTVTLDLRAAAENREVGTNGRQ